MAEPKNTNKVKNESASTKVSVPAPAAQESLSRRLFRSCKDRVLGGVAGGLGEYFDIDSAIIRLIFVLIALMGGAGVLTYVIAWIVIPQDPDCAKPKESSKGSIAQKAPAAPESRPTADTRRTGGFILLGLGLIFLLQSTLGLDTWDKLWPLVLIVIGISLLLSSRR